MKHFLLILALLLLPALPTLAQNDDEIVGGSNDLVVGGAQTPVGNADQFVRPAFCNTDCSHLFIEGTLVSGTDRDGGLGFNATWLPNHWGAYGTLSFLNHSTIFTCGAALRPIAHPRLLDWQLYAGAAFCDALGFEVGMRFSATANGNGGSFAWWSGSIGRIYINHSIYYTIGFSVSLTAMLGWVIW